MGTDILQHLEGNGLSLMLWTGALIPMG